MMISFYFSVRIATNTSYYAYYMYYNKNTLTLYKEECVLFYFPDSVRIILLSTISTSSTYRSTIIVQY